MLAIDRPASKSAQPETAQNTSAPPKSTLAHRRDIDGLRAVAVCAVILVHAGVTAVSGGFLGVDVFFVISGYLIHGNISREVRAGSFRPFAFYGRRMRRTLPALFAVVVVSLIAGAVLCLPGEFAALARSAIASALSFSNIFFLQEVGYFDHDALTKPLLHTWSLGVEEQFYLVAPLISVALYRARASIRPALYIAVLLATFAVCVLLQRAAPAAAFFLMPARIWEFLVGCAVAEQVVPRVRSRWLAELITIAALGGLIGSFAVVSETSAHPGFATLIPCLATAAIIHVGGDHRTVVARLLANPVARFLGLISYSLYLWHWPLIVFATDLALPHSVPVVIASALLLLALSAASWRFIEQPFRDPVSIWRRHALPALAGGAGAILIASTLIVVARGLPNRFGPDVAQVSSYFDYGNRRNIREGACFISSKYGTFDAFDRSRCLAMSTTKPNYLLVGDSLAAHTWIGLSTVMTDLNVMQATASGCKPTLDPAGKRYCTDLVNYILRDFIRTHHVDGIIFSGAWSADDAARVAATVAYTKRFVPNVFVIGPCPIHDMDLPNLIGRSMIEGRPGLVRQQQSEYPWIVEAAFRKAVGDKTIVSQLDLLCPGHTCLVLAGKDVPFQYDKSHMTSEGSILIAHLYKDAGAFMPRHQVSQAAPNGMATKTDEPEAPHAAANQP